MGFLAATGETTYSTIITAIGSAFGDIVSNTGVMVVAVLPGAITIFGMVMLIGFGKKVFSKITGKS